MKNMCRLISVILIILLLLSFPAVAAAESATVNSSSAKFYRSNSTSSASVPLKKGISVTVKDVSGSWAKVSYKGVTGYVPVKYLDSASRYAAYISKSTYIYKSASTSSSKKSVDVNTKVYVVGKSGNYYRVENGSGSAIGYVPEDCVSRSRVSTSSGSSWKSKVVMLDWFKGGSSVLGTGHYGYIYDVSTGITMRIKRMGGHNHADVEPASATDTAKLLRVAKGKFSWDSHAVILSANGKYVACGINTLPHGDQTIHNNNYNGQFCLHMTGSKTHGSDKENSEHQKSINRAYNWARK